MSHALISMLLHFTSLFHSVASVGTALLHSVHTMYASGSESSG